MKRVNPDITTTVLQSFINETGFLRKFKRYWGTEIVNGVEVFAERNYYFPKNRFEESTKKLARLLGIYDDLQGDMSGVRSAWLYLNIDKAPDVQSIPTGNTHTQNMNKALIGVTSGSVTISSKVLKKKSYVEAPIHTSVNDQEGLAQEILDKFTSLWNDDFTIYGNSIDDYQSVFFMYLLRSEDIEYTIDKIEKVTVPVAHLSAWDQNSIRLDTQPSWRVNFSFNETVVGDNTDIMVMLENDIKTPTKMATKQVLQRLDSAVSDAGRIGDVDYPIYEPTTLKSSDLWQREIVFNGVEEGLTNKYYLKTSILENTAMSRQERIKYIASCIDTGYRKKSAKWYEVVIAIVIIVVVTIYSAGSGTSAAAAGFWGTVTGVATTITMVAFYLSIIAYALGAAGLTRMAGTLGEFLKTVEPLVRIASIISIVGSFVNILGAAKASADEAAKQAVQEGVTTAAVEASTTQVIAETGKALIEQITGLTRLANMSTTHVLKMTEFLFGVYQSEQQRQMKSMIKNYRAELAEYEQMDEQSKTSDILKDFALSYPDLLSQDHSEYANLYDRPYEWWATPYHTGCIQANTVNALWLSKD